MISVIIPTYLSTEHLNLCLQSAFFGVVDKRNVQILVVVDGTMDIVRPVLDKFRDHGVEYLDLGENYGLCRATNMGVYNARYEKILIVNDDNVFPLNWDKNLEELIMEEHMVFAPNQVEPHPSMFQQFVIEDLGDTPETFDIEKWYKRSAVISKTHQGLEMSGSTLPIFMYKQSFIKIGGWDENYPMGMVADWDFFLKCTLNGFQMWRTFDIPFYHFASASVNSYERQVAERSGHEYAMYKWGTNIKHNPNTNEKYL